MTKNKSLYDVKVGDTVAVKAWGSYSKWEQARVEKVTPQYIELAQEVSRFSKKDGSSKGDFPKTISIVTSEIQEEWDKEHYKLLIRKLLESNHVSSKVLREVMETMTQSLTK